MLGIASRFRPWGSPFAPYPIKLSLSTPQNQSSLYVNGTDDLILSNITLTNLSDSLTLQFSSQLLPGVLSGMQFSQHPSGGSLQPGQSATVSGQLYPTSNSNMPYSSFGNRYRFRVTAFSPQAWALHNSTDYDTLNRNLAYKVSRSVFTSAEFDVSGQVTRDA